VEHPRPVEREPEYGAEPEADDVARDVVGEHAREAQRVVRDPQAREGDEHAAHTDEHELGPFAHDLVALGRAERPVPVAEIVGGDGEAGGDDLREERPLVQHRRFEQRGPEDVEDSDIDDESDEADDPEARELGEQLAHGVPPGATEWAWSVKCN